MIEGHEPNPVAVRRDHEVGVGDLLVAEQPPPGGRGELGGVEGLALGDEAVPGGGSPRTSGRSGPRG